MNRATIPVRPLKLKNSPDWLLYALFGAIAILIASNIYLLNHYLDTSETVVIKDGENKDIEIKKMEFENYYYRMLDSLNQQKSDNMGLNDLIEDQKYELDGIHQEIQRKIEDGLDDESLKVEMAKLNNRINGYLTRITELEQSNDSLSTKVETLAYRNNRIRGQKSFYQNESSLKSYQIDSINKVKSMLVSQVEQEKFEKNNIQGKMNTALEYMENKKYIILNSIAIQPIIEKNGKKTKETKRAKKANAYRFCIETQVNPIAELGDQIFYLQVINSLGETIRISDKEITLEDGTNVIGVLEQNLKYDGTQQKDCLIWAPSDIEKLDKGNYAVNAYHRGRPVGEGEFRLK